MFVNYSSNIFRPLRELKLEDMYCITKKKKQLHAVTLCDSYKFGNANQGSI